MWRKNFIFVAVLLLASSMAWAQTRATISGTIADETGARLPGVEVTVTNLDTGIARSVLSNDEGSYLALDLSLGNYQIEAALPGFQTAVRTGIQLTMGREAVVQMTLRVGEIAERVTVTGEAPLVETTLSVLADLVEQRTIVELPLNGRSFTDLALLQAGAMVRNGQRNRSFSPISGGGTRVSIGGARPKQNAYVLDGQNAKDAFGNTPGSAAGTVLGVETVREFSVLTNAYSAEYAGAGGIISAVTKSGTNNIHGSVFWFHRNDNLDAVDYNTKIANAEQPEFRRHQFGFTVGGPIVTDQTFFFGAYEGLRQILGSSRTFSTLSNAARNETIIEDEGRIFPIADAVRPYLAFYDLPNGIDLGDGTADFNFATSEPTRENYFLAKVDHTFSDTDSIDVRYSIDDAVAELYYSGGDVARFERHPDTRRQLFNTTWRRILSPNLFNSASASFNRSFGGLPNIQLGGDPALNFLPDRLFGQISGNTVDRIGTDAAGGGDRLSILNLFEYADTVSYTVGRHSIKFGGKVSRTHLNGLSGSRLHGRMVFRGLEDFLAGDTFQFEFLNPVGEGSSIRGYRQTMVSTFIQDDFKLRPGLTLNGG
ncbi:MAG: carboxypeptidase-like regulatory domain-containing protein, partial [Acidobacteria bacterium]|nr:carboxypeptidase-like regulatory domain-containing protein [Acidobacteriota bacterium]